ncbi:MAG: transglutaminase family protein [Nitrospinota bacterium]|nr:transglutaminase family protein [Nitrospinota bacterium]MDH5678869.1 transglutaminase family protein [Nitrospinota bacterium]
MRFDIRHLIKYRYGAPVFPEPHIIRLRPRCDVSQKLLSHHLRITPEAEGLADNVDLAGGSCTLSWFTVKTGELLFEAVSQVETFRSNPFDFILPDPRYGTIPMTYPEEERRELVSFLAPVSVGAGVRALVDEGRQATGDDPLAFLIWLTKEIRARVAHRHRDEPGLMDPEATLAEGEGACRDMVALFVAATRSVGVAARFVSGYQAGEGESEQRELHSWAEIYLHGGGWRGYDPTAGIACGPEHVALASASVIDLTAPVTGTYRGDSGCDMTYEVVIEAEST